MDIVNDPRGSLQNMILVTKKIGERESEIEKKQKKKTLLMMVKSSDGSLVQSGALDDLIEPAR